MTDLEAAKALMDGVTEGPWELDGIAIAGSDPRAGDVCLMGEPAQYPGDTPCMLNSHEANARFIAAARDLVPALIAEVEALRAERNACAQYLKDGETPVERIEREVKDCIMLMGMLANDRKERDAARVRAEAALAALHRAKETGHD